MTASDAQKRATAKWVKQNVRSKLIKFYPRDHDLFEFVSAQENQNQYIMDLIRSDMEGK